MSFYVPMFVSKYVCMPAPPPRGWEVGSRGWGVHGVRDPWVGTPGGRFAGVEGDQRRGRSSGVGKRVGGMGSGWRWRRGSVQVTGGPGAKPLG